VTWGHGSHGRFLSSGTPMTVQHVVQEPQDFPGTMAGAEAALGVAAAAAGAAAATAPARSDILRFASPIARQPKFSFATLPSNYNKNPTR
jgi:hypothetical protein